MKIKIFLFSWCAFNLAFKVYYDYDTHPFFFIYYFTHWGQLGSFLSSGAEILAAYNKERYQKIACLLSEMALSFNLLIVPCFWICMRSTFDDYDYTTLWGRFNAI